MDKLKSLHKHWIKADAVKQVVMTKIGGSTGRPDEFFEVAEMYSSFARLSVLYALIYVVIEGYKELKCADQKIDSLLEKEDFVDALRMFRNATFHYQKKAITEKELKFLELKESEAWIKDLHKAFRLYFEKVLPIREMIDKLNI